MMPDFCPLCKNANPNKIATLDGYKEGSFHDIFLCKSCDTAFTWPMIEDQDLYNKIYLHGTNIPGYDRYHKFRNCVKKSSNPLMYLGNQEDVYWACGHYLKKKNDKDLKILEIGCGLGYLTYALVKAGYDTIGYDISENAIKEATNHFGPYYIHDNFDNLINKFKNRFDLIIMNQMIEHVSEINDFLSKTTGLLSENGSMLISTPNKSLFDINTVWNADLPPVHLWWLSEKSFATISKNLNAELEFIDFSSYHKNHFQFSPGLSVGRQIFDKDLNLIDPVNSKTTCSRFSIEVETYGIINFLKMIKWTLLGHKRILGSRGNSLLAILTLRNDK